MSDPTHSAASDGDAGRYSGHDTDERRTDGWEIVVGLEVHVQLATERKLFALETHDPEAEPNTSISPLTFGLPGTLPVLNPHAVELALRVGLALECDVEPVSTFARKHYFYPDLPKGYQISQYETPICCHGRLRFACASRANSDAKDAAPEHHELEIERMHIEEDAGRSIHTPSGAAHIDYNRAGVPLVEIVTAPQLRSAHEAAEALRALHEIVTFVGASEANMELGQFRCDANVSVRPAGAQTLGTRTEIKNLNSFRFVERAIEHEAARQIERFRAGGAVVQQTRLYDPGRDVTVMMRKKERADDYRYFDDPDLPPVRVSRRSLDRVQSTLPELPARRRARWRAELGLDAADAATLSATRALADLFDAVIDHSASRSHTSQSSGATPRDVVNFFTGDLLRLRNERDVALEALPIEAPALAELLAMQARGDVTRRAGWDVLVEMVDSGDPPARVVERLGLRTVDDTEALEARLRAVLEEETEAVARYRSGEKKLFGWLMGSAMRALRGRGDPQSVREILQRLLDET